MSDHNGSTKSPGKVVARNLAEVAHDAVTIAELQAALLKTELKQCSENTMGPMALLMVASLIFVGCIPVLMLALAFVLSESTGLSQALSTVIVVVSGFVISAILGLAAYQKLRKNSIAFERSRTEFSRNVAWIKQALKVIAGFRDAITPTMGSQVESYETARRGAPVR